MRKLIFLVLLVVSLNLVSCKVVDLNEENWDSLLKGEWMVEFFAPWCPACRSLEPTWNDFGSWSEDLSVKIAKVNIVDNPGLSGRFFVTALPTIYHVKEGQFRRYTGSRDINSFMSFIEDKKWSDIDPVDSWKKPDSMLMSILSWFFRLSHFLKELNNKLLQDYGLPTWASYAIFAIVTILIGTICGLLLVCVIDFIWPHKPMTRQTYSEKRLLTDSKEAMNEDIVDDTQPDDDEEATSDEEKISGSDEEEDAREREPSPKSSPDVRKRRARKAD